MRGGTRTSLVSLLTLCILQGVAVYGQSNVYFRTFATTALHRAARYGVTSAAGRTAVNRAAGGGAHVEVDYLRAIVRAVSSPLETLNSMAKLATHYTGVVNGWASELFNSLPAVVQFVLVPFSNPYLLSLYYIAVLLGLVVAYKTWSARDPIPTSTASPPKPAQHHHHHGGAASPGGWARKALGVFMAAGYLSTKPALHEAMMARVFDPTPTSASTFLPATCPAVPFYSSTMVFETAQHGSTLLFNEVAAPATLDIVYETCTFNFSAPAAPTASPASLTAAPAPRPFHRAGGRAWNGWTMGSEDICWLLVKETGPVPRMWRREEASRMKPAVPSLRALPNAGHALGIYRPLPIVTPAWHPPMPAALPSFFSNRSSGTSAYPTAEPVDMPSVLHNLSNTVDSYLPLGYNNLFGLVPPVAYDRLCVAVTAMAEGAGGWSQWVVEGMQQLGKHSDVTTFVSWDAQATASFNASTPEAFMVKSWGVTEVAMVEGHVVGSGVVSSSWKGHTHEHAPSLGGTARRWARVFESKLHGFQGEPELPRLACIVALELMALLIVYMIGSVGFMRVSISCSVLILSYRLLLIR